jgi:ankyrin repeat protein
VNARDTVGKTALMYVACARDTEMARLLLDAGANVNARDTEGSTALTHAARARDTERVRLLLDSAEANKKYGKVMALLKAAEEARHLDIVLPSVATTSELPCEDLCVPDALPIRTSRPRL